MTLFTEAQLTLGSSVIPIGAYTVYPIPAKDHWTVVVNKNVTPGAAYDEKQDIARAAMETAQVDQPSDGLEVGIRPCGHPLHVADLYGQEPRRLRTSWRSDGSLDLRKNSSNGMAQELSYARLDSRGGCPYMRLSLQ